MYNKSGYRKFLSSLRDKNFIEQYTKGPTNELLEELKASSKKLVYLGDKVKTEKKQKAEEMAILKEMMT